MHSRICFIVGFPRSGTTLLSAMLNRHSKLCSTPETMFYHRLYSKVAFGLRHGQSIEELADICLKDSRFADLGLDPFKFRAALRGVTSAEEVLRAGLSVFAMARETTYVVEKSPIHLLYWDQISRDFPDAKFLAIVRDGRASVASLLDVPWAHRSVTRHSAEWVFRMRILEEMQRQLGNRVHICKYENLVSEPKQEISRICDFLDIQFEASILRPSTDTSAVVPKWELQWKSHANATVSSGPVDRWRSRLTQDQISISSHIMRHELRRLGYATEHVPPKSGIRLTSLMFKPLPYRILRAARNLGTTFIRASK